MTVGAITKGKWINEGVVGGYLQGLYSYWITNKGKIARCLLSTGAIDFPFEGNFTYATAADEAKCDLTNRKFTAVTGNGTTLYVALDDGTICSITTSFAVVFICRLSDPVVAMQYASNVLYCACANGQGYSIATA